MGQRTGRLLLPTHLFAHQRPLCDNLPLPHRNICLAHVCRCLVTFINEVSSFSFVCSTQLKCIWRSSDFTFLPSCVFTKRLTAMSAEGFLRRSSGMMLWGTGRPLCSQSRCFRGAQIWQSLVGVLCQAPSSGIHSINTHSTPAPCSCIFSSQQWCYDIRIWPDLVD